MLILCDCVCAHMHTHTHTTTHTHTHTHIYTYTSLFSLPLHPCYFSASLLLFCTHHPFPSSLLVITTENSSPEEELCIRALSHQVCLGLIKSFLSRAVRGGTFKDLAPVFGPGKGVSLPSGPLSLARSLLPSLLTIRKKFPKVK